MSTTAIPDATPVKSRKKLFVIIALAGCLVIGGGGAAAYFLLPHSQSEESSKAVPPVFYALEPFTVNLASDEEEDARYIHIGLTLKVPDAKTQAQLTQYLPELRSRILLLLSAKHAAEIATTEGKRRLATEIERAAEQPFGNDRTSVHVDSVLFTDFVIQ